MKQQIKIRHPVLCCNKFTDGEYAFTCRQTNELNGNMIKIKKNIPGKNNLGFTLIEVIAVLIILGIIGVVIISRTSSNVIYSVKSQADILKSHIRYAQTMAMNTGIIWGINITGGKTYALFRDDDTTKTVLLPGVNSNPVVLESDDPSLSAGTVRFDEKGSPIDGGASFTVSKAGETETITITPNTGFIP
jgi:prepilin-type N-terminal cleavage/methylation domain-containing protein